jgi:hypothetical protein
MRLCGCEQATWEAGMSIPGRPALQSPSFVPIRHWPFLFPILPHKGDAWVQDLQSILPVSGYTRKEYLVTSSIAARITRYSR